MGILLMEALLIFAGIIIVCWIVWAVRSAEKQERLLLEKYQDIEIVERILAGEIWRGGTQEQVRDALGDPVDIDEKVYKTKTKTVWKYQQLTKTQFGLRITFENGVLVGWDKK